MIDANRGIVLFGGHLDEAVNVYLTIRLLRHLGCDLPIQWFYRGLFEVQPLLIPLFQDCGAEFVPLTCCTTRQAYDNQTHKLDARLQALTQCCFDEAIFLDTDILPVGDPTYLFDDPIYKKSGLLFWSTVSSCCVCNLVQYRAAMNLDTQLSAAGGHIQQVSGFVSHYLDTDGRVVFQRCNRRWRVAGNTHFKNAGFVHYAVCEANVNDFRIQWADSSANKNRLSTPIITYKPVSYPPLDLRTVKTFVYTIPRNTARQERITQQLNALGFTDWSFVMGQTGVAGRSHYWQNISPDLVRLLSTPCPLLLMEDDALLIPENYVNPVRIPDATDVLYLGGCGWGTPANRLDVIRSAGPNRCVMPFRRTKQVVPMTYTEVYREYMRVYNMYSGHAILYLNDSVRLALREALQNKAMQYPHDVVWGQEMWKYRVLCRKYPMWYQADGHNETGSFSYYPLKSPVVVTGTDSRDSEWLLTACRLLLRVPGYNADQWDRTVDKCVIRTRAWDQDLYAHSSTVITSHRSDTEIDADYNQWKQAARYDMDCSRVVTEPRVVLRELANVLGIWRYDEQRILQQLGELNYGENYAVR